MQSLIYKGPNPRLKGRTMQSLIYKGPNPRLKGRTALVKLDPHGYLHKNDPFVLAQFDSPTVGVTPDHEKNPECYGWHLIERKYFDEN